MRNCECTINGSDPHENAVRRRGRKRGEFFVNEQRNQIIDLIVARICSNFGVMVSTSDFCSSFSFIQHRAGGDGVPPELKAHLLFEIC